VSRLSHLESWLLKKFVIARTRPQTIRSLGLQLLIARLDSMFKQQQVETNTRDRALVWSLGSLFPKIAEKRQAVPIRDAMSHACSLASCFARSIKTR
jgi:hypothetical protein